MDPLNSTYHISFSALVRSILTRHSKEALLSGDSGQSTSRRPSSADYPPKCNGSQMADCEGGATQVMSGLCGSIYNKYFWRLNDSCGCWQGRNDGQELVYSNKQHRKEPIRVLSLKSVPYWWGRRFQDCSRTMVCRRCYVNTEWAQQNGFAASSRHWENKKTTANSGQKGLARIIM